MRLTGYPVFFLMVSRLKKSGGLKFLTTLLLSAFTVVMFCRCRGSLDYDYIVSRCSDVHIGLHNMICVLFFLAEMN